MSTLSALNNIQKQVTDLAPSSITGKNKVLGAETFEKTLDLAIKHKGLVLPAPVNLAVDVGLGVLEQKGLMPQSNPTSIKDGIEDVFSELSVGIASNFVAALSGQDSATAVTPVADNSNKKDAITVAAHADCLAHETVDDTPLISAKSVENTQNVLDVVSPYLPDNKIMPIANSTLSLLDDLMSDDDDKKPKRRS